MNKKEALEFLSQHQPMPDEIDITQELIDTYDDVRLYFMAHPDKEAIPLLLRSFGEGSGLGVYQLVDGVLDQCEFNDVVENLADILVDFSTVKSVRLWCTILAMSFPHQKLIEGLNISLQTDDEDTHDMALLSLQMIEETCR